MPIRPHTYSLGNDGQITFCRVKKSWIERFMVLILKERETLKKIAKKEQDLVHTLGKKSLGEDVEIFVLETNLINNETIIKEKVLVRKYQANNEIRKLLSKYNIFIA